MGLGVMCSAVSIVVGLDFRCSEDVVVLQLNGCVLVVLLQGTENG